MLLLACWTTYISSTRKVATAEPSDSCSCKLKFSLTLRNVAPLIDEAEVEVVPTAIGAFRRLSEDEFISTLNIHEAGRKGDLHVVKLLTKKDPKQMDSTTALQTEMDALLFDCMGKDIQRGGNRNIKSSLGLIYLAVKVKQKGKFQWIPSHVGIEGNERADFLARTAAVEGVSPRGNLTFSEISKISTAAVAEWYRTVDERGWTPIHLAAAHGHSEIVKLARSPGSTPIEIEWDIMDGNSSVINNQNYTPLYWPTKCDRSRIVAYRERGLSFRDIALCTDRNPTTVKRTWNQCAA
ncbi:ankyrin repeat, PH and SEC7 domain containing protein secG [Trichonephila clavipes]|nr:ankyrin repeat, PH and SEC7 domain containing protein secG [Trichonephila clavipes]